MTDRLAGVIVTFEHDIRDDDAEPIITALNQIKGVLTVTPVVADLDLHMAETRARHKLGEEIWKVLYPDRS